MVQDDSGHRAVTTRPRILLGVTIDGSLGLMEGLPQYLVDQGWDVHVVSAPGPRLDALSSVEGVSTHAIAMVRDPSPFADLKSLIAWIALLRRVNPDVISVGTPKAGMLGSIAGLLTRVPHRVYHLRGLRLETETDIQRRIFSAIERLTMAASHRVLSVSKSLRQRVIDLGLVNQSKVVVIGAGSSNGVDVSRFQNTGIESKNTEGLALDLGLVPGVPVVGFVGRLARDKGLDVLVRARRILAERGIDYQLLIVGGIDDSSGADRINQLRQTGRPLIQTGHVSDVSPYYRIMDILCLPTLREGFPNVVLEAAAMGVPTVTTSATGAIDSVVDEETGLIAEVASSHDLADKLGRLIMDESLRCALGKNARIHVKSNYERRHVWSQLDEFYRGSV